nr:MAG TPA_asm: hypothetical protein [Caudoviricetes sp.]
MNLRPLPPRHTRSGSLISKPFCRISEHSLKIHKMLEK